MTHAQLRQNSVNSDKYYKGKIVYDNNMVFLCDGIFEMFTCPRDRGFRDRGTDRRKVKGFAVKRNK